MRTARAVIHERPVTLPRRGPHRHGLLLYATTHTQRHNTRNRETCLSGSPFPPPRHTDCACERGLDPSLEGVPLAVVQYNPFQGDGSASASGVVSLPAEPSTARVVFKSGRLIMPSAANGSIIAVSYEARARGVTRFFRGREAIAACPEIVLVQVPTAREQCCHSNQARTERLGGRLTPRLCLCLRRAARRQERHGNLPLLRRAGAQDSQ